MQAIETRTNGDLMAAWRATGGACGLVDARPEAAAADGPQSGAVSFINPGICADDGLRAGAFTAAVCTGRGPGR